MTCYRPLRAALLLTPLLALTTLPAAATASLTCDANDRNVEFSLLGNVGQSIGANLQLTNGSIKLKAVRGKNDEIEFDLEGAHLVQQWVFEKELRIGVMTAEKNDVTLYLAIVAQQVKSNDEGDRYQGRYVLKVQSPKGTSDLKGRIKDCVAG